MAGTKTFTGIAAPGESRLGRNRGQSPYFVREEYPSNQRFGATKCGDCPRFSRCGLFYHALIVALLALCGCSASRGKPPLRVGSKNFTEQVVLGEIVAQHLEHRLHRSVERSLNLGGTLLAHQALLNRQIDLYPEYTGTALAAILKD